MANSIKRVKPSKPYSKFPLFAHATGRWAKKIRGKFVYFGPWSDPDSALQKYLDQKDDLHAGRTPRSTGDGLTIAELCNQFLNTKRRSLDAGEIADRSFRAYYDTCALIVDTFGSNRLVDDLSANDFESVRAKLAESSGPVALGNEIGRIRMVFKYGYDQSLIDKPIRYGQSFQKPSRKVLRIARNQSGKRMFEADELRTIIGAARQPFKAMALMAINCGFGQSDLANLPQSALDLENGWVDFPRPKTGVERRCPLWPETIEALKEAIEQRPEPKNKSDADLCFLTGYGNRWVRSGNQDDPGKRTSIDVVSKMFGEMLRDLGIDGHRNFYALRHTFQTIGGESKDPDAVSSIMGHVDGSMAATYREGISDSRLQAVTDTVRSWLWAGVAETE